MRAARLTGESDPVVKQPGEDGGSTAGTGAGEHRCGHGAFGGRLLALIATEPRCHRIDHRAELPPPPLGIYAMRRGHAADSLFHTSSA
jgi:hypothetical protein